MAAAANGRIALSQFDLLPGGNLSGHSNVYTINPDGAARRQFTHVSAKQAAGAPDWSADGTKIVYERNQTGDYRIWVMNANGSGQRQLTNDPGFADLEPAWSPDGTHILFSRCDDHLGAIAGCDLVVMNAAGTGIRRLAGGHWTYVRGEYSPDGRHIVVAADRGGLLSALWVMRADGTHRRLLVPFLTTPTETNNFDANVSSDGRHITFTRFGFHGIISQVWMADISGAHAHPLTAPQLEAGQPTWSPDGSHIAFASDSSRAQSAIYAMQANGTGITRLAITKWPTNNFGPAYAPDGSQIAFSSDRLHPDLCVARFPQPGPAAT